jgi:hypothetical protein
MLYSRAQLPQHKKTGNNEVEGIEREVFKLSCLQVGSNFTAGKGSLLYGEKDAGLKNVIFYIPDGERHPCYSSVFKISTLQGFGEQPTRFSKEAG